MSEPRQLDRIPSNVAAEQVRLLALQTRSAFLGNLVIMLILVAAFWNRTNHFALIAWAACLVLAVFMRVIIANRFLQAWPHIGKLGTWQFSLTMAIFMLGLVWGVAALLFYPHDSPWLLALLLILLSGLTSAGIGSMSSYLPAYLAYTVPMMGTLDTRVLLDPNSVSPFVGTAGVFYLFICITWARNMNRTIVNSITLHFENIELVDQLKTEKERAEQANQAKSRFLAAASHDLRQPLHALNLYLDLMATENDPEKRREILTHIQQASDALTGLFDALLDISRLDAGRIDAQPRHIPVQPLLDTLYREYALQARQQGLVLRRVNSRACLHSDPVLLDRILRNLLSNALRYTESGRILLGCRRRANGLRLVVADTGIGIPPDEQARIFTEFHQLHNPERDRAKGLGLGLAIVRRLAELLDHPLHVWSEPGKGSVFCLDVPYGDPARCQASDPPPREAAQATPGARILLIDDETAVLDAMQALLEKWGHQVMRAESQAEALALLEQGNGVPDVVLCDYRLRDGRNGFQAVAALRERLGPSLPAVLVSGDTAPAILEQAAAAGLPILHKPLKPARLRALLDALLAGHSDVQGAV